MQKQFETLTLELTGDAMWNPVKVDQALVAVEQNRLDGIVFHEADILTKIVFPSNYDPATSDWHGTRRRGVWAIVNNRAYLQDVARRCAARGVMFLLETKELGYPDEFLEDVPDLVVDGVVCPTHPAWEGLLERRYAEVCRLLPELTGFVVSVGTLEGRASLTTRRCQCERCAATDDIAWHRGVVSAIHRVTERFGRTLVVREFSYNPQDQEAVVAGLSRLPASVEYMVKPYARDYYLPWPDNPALGSVPGRRKWLEYDCHGQYFGWGIFPLSVLPDQLARFRSAAEAGCSVLQLRVDWERINGLWAFDTFGKVNVATAALAARSPQTPPEQLLAAALRSTGVVVSSTTDETVVELARHWLDLYPLALRVLYVTGNVYNTSSMIPNGVAQGWSYMSMLHAMRGWHGPSIGSLDVADPEVVQGILAEKAGVASAYEAWHRRMYDWQASGVLRLPDPARLGDVLEWSRLYVDAFVRSAEVVVLVKAAEARSLTEDERAALQRAAEALDLVRATLEARGARLGHTHHARLLVDPAHLHSMVISAHTALGSHLVG